MCSQVRYTEANVCFGADIFNKHYTLDFWVKYIKTPVQWATRGVQLVSLRSHGTVRCCSARVSVGGAVGPVSSGSWEGSASSWKADSCCVFCCEWSDWSSDWRLYHTPRTREASHLRDDSRDTLALPLKPLSCLAVNTDYTSECKQMQVPAISVLQHYPPYFASQKLIMWMGYGCYRRITVQ